MNQPSALRFNAIRPGRVRTTFVLAAALAGFAGATVLAENTNSMFKPTHAWPGGLDPRPEISSVSRAEGSMIVKWFGIQGPYQVQRGSSVAPESWEAIGGPTYDTTATMSLDGGMGIVRIQGSAPNYAGWAACQGCHRSAYTNWIHTAHFRAFTTLKEIKQDSNPQCLPCHTVGFGLNGGFVDWETTPLLAGVQCENCHGPSANHVADFTDLSVRPSVTIAAEVCGGCHTDAHHPTFDEWKESLHGIADPHVADGFISQGEPRMLACGPCHSGAVRLALLNQLKRPNEPLPSREDAAYFPITCATCHNAHENTLASQLRNPTYSLQNFSYSTSTNTSFAKQYDPTVQLCAQCHNMRGARWQDTGRPPHHSPQYNVLVAQGGFDFDNHELSTHARDLQKQCAHCHTHPHEVEHPDENAPNYTGHTFEMHYEACAECHGSAEGSEALTMATQNQIRNRIAEVQALLESWSTNKAPEVLRNKYGQFAWEYTTAGQLSNPEGLATIKGPTSAEQTEVPDAIKQARMNLYLVEHDGSYGVHNGRYARWLLNVAKTNVVELLQ